MSTAPRRLGKYELRQLLGRGHVGAIWQAYNVAQKQDVAVKILHSDLQADPHFLDRFANMGQALLSLHQENLIHIYDAVITRPEQARETTVYLAMDLISGYTLTDFLQATSNRGIFPPIAEIAYLFHKLGAAVDYLHINGIVHGDIKPSNILLDQQRRNQFKAGEPVLTDVSMTLIAGNDSQLNAPHYIAPEQAQGQEASSSSDIYALGILLYELCAGIVPFRGETPYAVIAQQINALPTPPMLINPNIPPALSDVILRSLAKDVGTRFQSASALANAIAEACSLGRPDTNVPNAEQYQVPGLAYPNSMPLQTQQSILGVPQQLTPANPVYMRPLHSNISQPLPRPQIAAPNKEEVKEATPTAQSQAQPQEAHDAVSQQPAISSDHDSQKSGPHQATVSNAPSSPIISKPLFVPHSVSHHLEDAGTPPPQAPAQPQVSQLPRRQGPNSFAPISNAPFTPPAAFGSDAAYPQQQAGQTAYPQQQAGPEYAPYTAQPQAPATYGQYHPQPSQQGPLPPNPTPPKQLASTSASSMKKVVLLLVAIVVVLAAVFGITRLNGSGTDKAQQNNPVPAGTAPGMVYFQDSSFSHDDQLHIIINGVPAPANGQTYALWLQTQQQTLLLDTVSVQNQQIVYTYPGNDQRSNLLANIQGILVTSEDAAGKPQTPSQQIIYSGKFNDALLKPLRSILYQTPELADRSAVATDMFETIKSLNDKAASIVDSLQNTGDTGLATRQATRIIEMIDGTRYAAESGHLPKGIPSQGNLAIGLLSTPQQTGYIDIFSKHLDEVKAQAGNNAALLTRIQNTENALVDLHSWVQEMEQYGIQILAKAANDPAQLRTSTMVNTALQLKQEAAYTYTGRVVPPDTSPTTKQGSAGAQQAYTEAQYAATLYLNKTN